MSLQLQNVSLNHNIVLAMNPCCLLYHNVNNASYLDRHQTVPTNMLHQGQLPEYLFKLNDKISGRGAADDEPQMNNKAKQANKPSPLNAILTLKESFRHDNHPSIIRRTRSIERRWHKRTRRRRQKRNDNNATNESFTSSTTIYPTKDTSSTDLNEQNSSNISSKLDTNNNNSSSFTDRLTTVGETSTTLVSPQNDSNLTTNSSSSIGLASPADEQAATGNNNNNNNNFSESMDIISSDEILSSPQEPHHNNGNSKGLESLLDYSGNQSATQDHSGYYNANVIRIHPRMIIRLIGMSMMAAMLMTVVTCFVCKRYLKCKNSTCCCCLRLYHSAMDDDDDDIDDHHPSSTNVTYEHPLNGCYRNGLNSSGRRQRDPYAICPYQLIFNRNNQRPPPLYSPGSTQVVNTSEQLLMPDQSDQQRTQVQGSNLYILNNDSNLTGSHTGLIDHQQQQHHQQQLYCSSRNEPQRQHYANNQTASDQQLGQPCYNVILENLELNHFYDPVTTYNANNNCDQTNYHIGSDQQQQQYAVTSSESICNQQQQQQQQQQFSRLTGCDQSSSASSNPSLWANVNILSSSALTKARLLSAEDLLNLAKLTEIPIIIAASDEPPQVILSKFNQLKSSLTQQNQQSQQSVSEDNVDEPHFCLLAPTSNLMRPSSPPNATRTVHESVENPVPGRALSINCQTTEPYLRLGPMLDPPPPYSNINTTAVNIVNKFIMQSSRNHHDNNGLARSSIDPPVTSTNCPDHTVDSGLDTGNDTATDETVETSGTIPLATSSDSGLTSGDEIISETTRSCQQNNTGHYFTTPLSDTK